MVKIEPIQFLQLVLQLIEYGLTIYVALILVNEFGEMVAGIIRRIREKYQPKSTNTV